MARLIECSDEYLEAIQGIRLLSKDAIEAWRNGEMRKLYELLPQIEEAILATESNKFHELADAIENVSSRETLKAVVRRAKRVYPIDSVDFQWDNEVILRKPRPKLEMYEPINKKLVV